MHFGGKKYPDFDSCLVPVRSLLQPPNTFDSGQRKPCHSNDYAIKYDFDHCNNDISYIELIPRAFDEKSVGGCAYTPFTLAFLRNSANDKDKDKVCSRCFSELCSSDLDRSWQISETRSVRG